MERNFEVLKKLEEDYIAQQKTRVNLNEELKAQGFNSLEEKMEHLKEVAKTRADEISGMFSPKG